MRHHHRWVRYRAIFVKVVLCNEEYVVAQLICQVRLLGNLFIELLYRAMVTREFLSWVVIVNREDRVTDVRRVFRPDVSLRHRELHYA